MIRLYLDENVRGPVTRGLRTHDVDCLTAMEDGYDCTHDELVLARATALGRVVLTYDDDFLRIAHQWLAESRPFPGIIKSNGKRVPPGIEIEQVWHICRDEAADALANLVLYLPQRGK